MELGWSWEGGQGQFPDTVTCVTAPLLLHHCLWAPVLAVPLFPDLIGLPRNSGLAHSPESLRQGQPGRAELEQLLPQVWPQESTALQAGSWPLKLLLAGIIIPRRDNFAWGIFCKEFLVIIGTKVCRRKLFFFPFFFFNCSIFPSFLNVWKSTSLHSVSQQNSCCPPFFSCANAILWDELLQ